MNLADLLIPTSGGNASSLQGEEDFEDEMRDFQDEFRDFRHGDGQLLSYSECKALSSPEHEIWIYRKMNFFPPRTAGSK